MDAMNNFFGFRGIAMVMKRDYEIENESCHLIEFGMHSPGNDTMARWTMVLVGLLRYRFSCHLLFNIIGPLFYRIINCTSIRLSSQHP